ncbi:hypothetical protein Tco_1529572, partial [Tanacetum coccineum]
FHSHCPQTARMYYHPPADVTQTQGGAKTVNGGAAGGGGESKMMGLNNPSDAILYSVF